MKAEDSLALDRPQFSLILATYGRSDAIGRLVATLVTQSEKRFELIVADQNMDERVAPYLQAARNAGISVQHLRLDKPNLSAARNAGLTVARGEWIAFPDDDCWYESGSLAAVLAAAEQAPELGLLVAEWPELGAAGFADSGAPGGRLSLAVWRRFRGGDASSITLFVRRSAVLKAGGFDARFGVGQWFGAGEETDLVLRLLTDGVAAGRASAALVHHLCHSGPTQLPIARLWRVTVSRGRGAGALYAKHRLGLWVLTRGLLAPVPKAIYGVLRGRAQWHSIVEACGLVWGRWLGWCRWRHAELHDAS